MYKTLFSCKNKIVVVTGGVGLIGQKIVRALKEFGAVVYIADIEIEKAKQLATELKCRHIHLDLASKGSIKDAISHVIQQNERIDVLINCAYPRTKDWGNKFENITFDSWTNNLNNHLGGYFLCCQEATHYMKKQRCGTIINIASIYGVVGPDFSIYENTDMTMPAAYSAIKGGLIALTRYLATYYGKYNIRANSVSPGGIFDNQQQVFVDRYCLKTPLGRMGKPDDIVGVAVFLVSEASSYITGQNIIVDGGWTAQ